MTASVLMSMPSNIISFVLGTQGTFTNSGNLFSCGEADAATILLDKPIIADSTGVFSATLVNMPANISGVTIGVTLYTPDANHNITIPALDATKIVHDQIFSLVNATGTNPG